MPQEFGEPSFVEVLGHPGTDRGLSVGQTIQNANAPTGSNRPNRRKEAKEPSRQAVRRYGGRALDNEM